MILFVGNGPCAVPRNLCARRLSHQEANMTVENKIRPSIKVLILVIFILALVLRGMAFLKFKDNMALSGDAKNYWLMSHQLADTGIYGYWYDGNPYGGTPGVSNARVMPGYPVFLAAIYKNIGDPYLQITAIRLLQAILGSLSALLAFAVVRRIFKKDLPAVLTALFVAVYPPYILSSTVILTEVPGLFTMLLYFYIAAIAFETGKKSLNVLAGAAFGLHILIRPALLPLFIVPFAYLLISGVKRKEHYALKGTFRGKADRGPLTARKVGLYFLLQLMGFVVVMAPWWIRNLITLGAFILTAKGDGNALLAGTYPYWQDFMKDNPENIKGVNDAQRAWGIQRIIAGLKTDPGLYIKWFTLGKTDFTFAKPYLAYLLPEMTVQMLIHKVIIFSGVLGMIWHSIRSIKGFYFYLYGLILLGLQLLFVPDPRYAYILMFFVMVGSAHLVSNLWELIRRRMP